MPERCVTHHRSVHRTGDERTWWQRQGIDPLAAARRLWAQTREMQQMRLEFANGTCSHGTTKQNAAE